MNAELFYQHFKQLFCSGDSFTVNGQRAIKIENKVFDPDFFISRNVDFYHSLENLSRLSILGWLAVNPVGNKNSINLIKQDK
jgi:hypothetical protein